MNETENKNRRDLYLKIRVNREELEAIDRKFRNSGMKSRSEFVRAMIFEGYIVQFSEDKMNELLKLARSISNNVNQIAVRANSGGKVYADDIADIKKGVEELWQPLRYFQSLLMTLHH
ncbi:MAG: plasmid mobilization relaxosome protein MobC [Ruminococcus sp.]|nr:plasmid mobilization relaxosome protein MobC [Ruminococcus sp.]